MKVCLCFPPTLKLRRTGVRLGLRAGGVAAGWGWLAAGAAGWGLRAAGWLLEAGGWGWLRAAGWGLLGLAAGACIIF